MSDSNGSNGNEKKTITIARRCMEQFLHEMKLCSEQGCTKEERLSIANKYLASLDHCPCNPLLFKVKEVITSYINGQCRSIDSYIEEQIGERAGHTEWICSVCGRRNQETNKKFSQCVTCGRAKGCFVSKKLRRLNESRVDPTPHLTNASKDELRAAQTFEYRREKWIGDGGKRLIFVSNKSDYEAEERMGIKSEINNVIKSIHESLEAN